MATFGWIFGSLAVVGLVSLVGAVYLLLHKKLVAKLLPVLIGFATGALLAVSFFDLMPEGFELLGDSAPAYILGGLLLLLIFEQVLHLHHEHRADCDDCKPKQITGYAIVLIDGLHNFLDGILVASAYMASPTLGVATTIAVIAHEIPQELGDYAVLVNSGFAPVKALGLNLVSALMAMAGGVFGYFFLANAERLIPYFVSVGAGGLMYIALVDLLGEIRSHRQAHQRWVQLGAMLVGIVVLLVVMRIYAE